MSVAIPMGSFGPALVRRPAVTVPVTVYGSWWNVSGHRISRALGRAGIAHHYVDVETNPDARCMLQSIVSNALEFPVVYIDGEWLMAPTLETVQASLHRHGPIPAPESIAAGDRGPFTT